MTNIAVPCSYIMQLYYHLSQVYLDMTLVTTQGLYTCIRQFMQLHALDSSCNELCISDTFGNIFEKVSTK